MVVTAGPPLVDSLQKFEFVSVRGAELGIEFQIKSKQLEAVGLCIGPNVAVTLHQNENRGVWDMEGKEAAACFGICRISRKAKQLKAKAAGWGKIPESSAGPVGLSVRSTRLSEVQEARFQAQQLRIQLQAPGNRNGSQG